MQMMKADDKVLKEDSEAVQIPEIASSSCEEDSPKLSLLKKLKEKLCPKLLSFHEFNHLNNGILNLLLSCTHLQDTEQCTFHRAQQTVFTVADLIEVVRISNFNSYSNWKYSCVSSENLNPKPIMIGLLTLQTDGSIQLVDPTGCISCIFTFGSTSFKNCPIDHNFGLGWSVHCIVAVGDFYVVSEKKMDSEEQVYLLVNEEDVIPLTDSMNDNRMIISTAPAPADSSVSFDSLADNFNQLSISNKESSRTVPKSIAEVPDCGKYINESSHLTVEGKSSTSSLDSKNNLFIGKLIVPIHKTLPTQKKNGLLGFRLEIQVVSNVVVENDKKEVFKDIGRKNGMATRQALDFYGDAVKNHGQFQMNMVYDYKKPLCRNSEECLDALVKEEICRSVTDIIKGCKFIPFMKSCEFCPVHNFEVLPLHSFKYQHVSTHQCLCSESDDGFYCVSLISAPTTCYSNMAVKGTVESKEYRYDTYGDAIVLTLSDSSAKMNLYLKSKSFHSSSYLLGLLPGMEVLFSGLQCHYSKNNNLYLTSNNDLSIQLLQYTSQAKVMKFNELPVLPEEKKMPLYFFSKINGKMTLFRSISFILKIISLSIVPITNCGDTTRFYVGSSTPLDIKACFLADDGSDQRYVKCKGDTVAQLLSITKCEWKTLKHLAKNVEGGLHFKMATRWQENPLTNSSPEMQLLSKLCQRSSIMRQMVLLCKAYETDPYYSNGDAIPNSGTSRSTMIFCISMCDGKTVKLTTELFGHIKKALC